MEKCDTLQGYSLLVMKIREFQSQGMTLEEAADTACQYCIEHDILRNFLLKNRNEVRNVLLTEYNAKHQRKLDRRDARAEGRAEGITEGRAESIERLLRKGKSPEEIHDLLDYPMEDILRVERELSAVK
jgi:nucleotide-binding universal stress UspA family protein